MPDVRIITSGAGEGFSLAYGQIIDSDELKRLVGDGWVHICETPEDPVAPVETPEDPAPVVEVPEVDPPVETPEKAKKGRR